MDHEKRLERIEVVDDVTSRSRCDEGFLRVSRFRLRNVWEDGTRSREYSCDVVSRRWIDAVAVVLWHREGDRVLVHLRRATRATVWLRRTKQAELVRPDARAYDTIVELVAGVLEADDRGPDGVRRRGAIEAKEEAGFDVDPARAVELGDGFFPSPGVSDEKVWLIAAEVVPGSASRALGDGSVMEEGSSTIVLELGDAIARCRSGEIPDAKTEIGLRRLADHLGFIPELGIFADALTNDLRARYDRLGVPAPRS
jgi:ADP-ribose pyrophosphatase